MRRGQRAPTAAFLFPGGGGIGFFRHTLLRNLEDTATSLSCDQNAGVIFQGCVKEDTLLASCSENGTSTLPPASDMHVRHEDFDAEDFSFTVVSCVTPGVKPGGGSRLLSGRPPLDKLLQILDGSDSENKAPVFVGNDGKVLDPRPI